MHSNLHTFEHLNYNYKFNSGCSIQQVLTGRWSQFFHSTKEFFNKFAHGKYSRETAKSAIIKAGAKISANAINCNIYSFTVERVTIRSLGKVDVCINFLIVFVATCRNQYKLEHLNNVDGLEAVDQEADDENLIPNREAIAQRTTHSKNTKDTRLW